MMFTDVSLDEMFPRAEAVMRAPLPNLKVANVYNRINKHTALRYPFQMTDSNPRGQDWLRGLLGKTS